MIKILIELFHFISTRHVNGDKEMLATEIEPGPKIVEKRWQKTAEETEGRR